MISARRSRSTKRASKKGKCSKRATFSTKDGPYLLATTTSLKSTRTPSWKKLNTQGVKFRQIALNSRESLAEERADNQYKHPRTLTSTILATRPILATLSKPVNIQRTSFLSAWIWDSIRTKPNSMLQMPGASLDQKHSHPKTSTLKLTASSRRLIKDFLANLKISTTRRMQVRSCIWLGKTTCIRTLDGWQDWEVVWGLLLSHLYQPQQRKLRSRLNCSTDWEILLIEYHII